MNRLSVFILAILVSALQPAVAGTFTFTADILRCQMSSVVRGTCITSHEDEPFAWRALLDCRIREGSQVVQLKLDTFEDIADITRYTVQLLHPDVLPRTWYCTANDGEYFSIFGTSFSGQQQSSECFWHAGPGFNRP